MSRIQCKSSSISLTYIHQFFCILSFQTICGFFMFNVKIESYVPSQKEYPRSKGPPKTRFATFEQRPPSTITQNHVCRANSIVCTGGFFYIEIPSNNVFSPFRALRTEQKSRPQVSILSSLSESFPSKKVNKQKSNLRQTCLHKYTVKFNFCFPKTGTGSLKSNIALFILIPQTDLWTKA